MTLPALDPTLNASNFFTLECNMIFPINIKLRDEKTTRSCKIVIIFNNFSQISNFWYLYLFKWSFNCYKKLNRYQDSVLCTLVSEQS